MIDRPPLNVVLLGASNLTIGFPLIVRQLGAGLPAPARVMAAMGHGRSYGAWSRIFHRSLPGIVQCGIWDALARHGESGGRSLAMITDIGNDLMYGVPVPQIAEWVEVCLQRLTEARADTVMTMIPMASVRRLGAVHYTCARTLLFPRCRITWPDMCERVHDLDARTQQLAAKYGAGFVEPSGEWYGLDPIHIRPAHRPLAWQQVFSAWPEFDSSADSPPLARSAHYRLRRLRPALRRVFGRDQVTPQPDFQLDRLSVGLY